MSRFFFAAILTVASSIASGALAADSASHAASPGSASFLLYRTQVDEGRLAEARAELAAALEAAPGDPYLHVEAARFYLRLGQLGAAGQEADSAVLAAPKNAEVLKIAGQVYSSLAERDRAALSKAKACFEAVRAARAGDLESLVSLGQLYMSSGEAKPATEALKEALAYYPQHPMILAMLADASEEAKDSETQEFALRSLVDLAPEKLEARLKLVDLLIERGEAGEAVQLLGAAPADQVTSAEITRRLALARYQTGDLAGAMGAIEALLAERPDFAGGRYLKGMILLADGKPAEAVVELQRLLRADPENPELAAATARALQRAGKWQEAAEILADSETSLVKAKREPEAIEARLGRADLLVSHGKLEEALALTELPAEGEPRDIELVRAITQARIEVLARLERWDEAIAAASAELLPDPGGSALRAELEFRAGRESEARALLAQLTAAGDARSLVAAAEALQRTDRHAETAALLEQARRLEPGSARLAFQHGVALERSHRLAEAEAALARAVELAPDFAAALNYLAYLWADSGQRLPEAARMAEKAVAISPETGAYVDTLGWVRFRQGALREARSLLERALRLTGDDATLHEHLGDVAAALGDREAAERSWEKALALGVETKEAVEQKLSALRGKRGS